MTTQNASFCTACPEPVAVHVSEYTIELAGIEVVQFQEVVSKIEGSDKIYQLPATPINSDSVVCSLNSGVQRPGIDYTISGDLLTWTEARTDDDVVLVSFIGSTKGATEGDTPIGMPQAWSADISIPDGYLECNGQEVLIASYPGLFSKVGTTFNTGGETSGYFRMPSFVPIDANFIYIIKT